MSSNWFKLDVDKLAGSAIERTNVRGVTVELAPSPFDVPDAVSVVKAEGSDHGVLEFHYLAEEPWRIVEPTPGVFARIGKKTGRFYGAEIKVEQPDVVMFEEGDLPRVFVIEVKKALDKLSHEPELSGRRINYRLAARALDPSQRITVTTSEPHEDETGDIYVNAAPVVKSPPPRKRKRRK